jgi:transposase
MTEITRVGLDLAKSVFQVHAVNAREQVVVRKPLRRSQLLRWFAKLPPCLVGMEACGGANHWARELTALGHTVRLIPPAYCKAYVRRNKNDPADAAAICEAVGRPSMRFVPMKTVKQQSEALTHKARELLMKQRTMTMNSLRGLMAEFGVVAPEGAHHIGKLLAILANPEDTAIPDVARATLNTTAAILSALNEQIAVLDNAIKAQVRDNPTARRLDTISGFGPGALTACRCIGPLRGPILSGAMAAIVTDPRHFDSGRDFAASLGVVPRQDGTGGKVKLGPISKRGNGYLRRLLVNGATAVINGKNARNDPWLTKMLDSKPKKLVAVALANKMARIAWAVMTRQEDFRPRAVTP